MTQEEMMKYIKGMTDKELLSSADQCYKDLIQAATLAPQSERHEECFSALFVLCNEMQVRGLAAKGEGIMQ